MTRALALAVVVLALAAPAAAQQHGIRFQALADVTMTAATATLIRASNQSRIGLTCTNTDTTNGIRLGDSVNPPTAARGVLLPPLSSVTYTATSALYGFPVAGTPTISCAEESS